MACSKRGFYTGLVPLLVAAGAASGAETASPEEMPLIEVTSTRLARPLMATPATVSIVHAPDLQKAQPRIQLDESLAGVPGLFFQNRYNFAQNLRLSSRGFGARSPFGIRGIRVQVDGIPYTLPDGQSQIDAVDLDSVERIEVIRGISSVQYGNASGGLIDIHTAKATHQSPGVRLRFDIAEDGYRKTTVQGSGVAGDTAAIATASWLRAEGHREQSEVEKGLFNARISHQIDDHRQVTATVNLLHTPKAQDPGGLTRDQVRENRDQATFMAKHLDSGQQVNQQILGVEYRDTGVLPGELSVNAFYTHRDFAQQLPFPGSSRLAYDRQFYGLSSQYQQDSVIGGRPLAWATGVDVHYQTDDRRRYTVANTGTVVNQNQAETQNATNVAAFALADLAMTERLNLSAGARFDTLRLSIDDGWLADGNDSDTRTFREISGVLGASYQLAATHQAYLTIGTAFESPTFTEFANPSGDGGFNPDISPQQALNREAGLRGLWGKGLSYDVAIFSTRVDDEILPYEIDGRTFYNNSGKTLRNGIELGLGYDLSYSWRLETALTLADYVFRTDRAGSETELKNNRLPGLPRLNWVSSIHWHGWSRRFAVLDVQYVGDLYAENSNTTKVDRYWLLGMRAGDSWRIGRQTLSLYGGVRNLLDETYFSNIRINANSDRPPADRGYFEPGAGRTVYAGAEIRF